VQPRWARDAVVEQIDQRGRRLVRHARTQLAVKATLAAVLAWYAASAFSADLERFRYYAPLGAVVTTYPTIASTVRQSRHAVLAVGMGAVLGLVVHQVLEPTVLGLVVVVATGIALGGLPFLGEQSSYVPIVALLVVAIGGAQPGDYALAYLSLTFVGAAIGVVVSLALPSTRLGPGHDALRGLERELADRLTEVADVLRRGEPPHRQEWDRRLGSLAPSVERMRRGVAEAALAQRGNPRAWWRGRPADRQVAIARSLERVHALTEDLVEMLSRAYHDELREPLLDDDLAAVAADALGWLATIVRSYHRPMAPDDEAVVAARRSVERLLTQFSRAERDADDLAVLGAVVATVQRCLDSVVPAGQDAS
jgi:uncharacterized membrane protein YgaE (UPF0421/DUF939 family)